MHHQGVDGGWKAGEPAPSRESTMDGDEICTVELGNGKTPPSLSPDGGVQPTPG